MKDLAGHTLKSVVLSKHKDGKDKTPAFARVVAVDGNGTEYNAIAFGPLSSHGFSKYDGDLDACVGQVVTHADFVQFNRDKEWGYEYLVRVVTTGGAIIFVL